MVIPTNYFDHFRVSQNASLFAVKQFRVHFTLNDSLKKTTMIDSVFRDSTTQMLYRQLTINLSCQINDSEHLGIFYLT